MSRQRMRGVYVVEFAIIGLLLFTLLFGVLEMGRLYFTVNALDEVVRRGARLAAVCDPSDPLEVEKILRRAIFNDIDDPGPSTLIGSLETGHLTLDYLDENGAKVANPGDTGFSSIRYVQFSINDPDPLSTKKKFTFNLLIPGFSGGFILPTFRSTIPRESLGRHAESTEITPC
ncbi:MAG: TadE/TadG family type IV pilus assembly protein [Pseudomonas sp.]|nr:TadE/TadG family type IV pilus assembly protein [Pseudomonas sp.]